MIKLNRISYIALLVGLTLTVTLTFMRRTEAQQNIGFLYPPYFGTSNVSAVFDHEYPVYDDEIDYPGDAITTTIRHNDGIRYQDTITDSFGYSGHDGIDYDLRYEYVLASHAAASFRQIKHMISFA